MGGRRVLSTKDRLFLQLVALVYLPLLPLILVIAFLFLLILASAALLRGDVTVLGDLVEPRVFWALALFPFAMTWENICVLFSRGPSYSDDDESRPNSTPANSEASRIARSRPNDSFVVTDAVAPAYKSCLLNGPNEFRLLCILPSSFEDPLRGKLITTSLTSSSRPSYDALSYTWADESGNADRTSMIVLESDQGAISITKNCETAIRRLRQSRRQRWVWIDAICINQESDDERSHQVSIMGRIYGRASYVVAYLGEGDADSDRLFDWLNSIRAADLVVPRWQTDTSGAFAALMEQYYAVGLEMLTETLRSAGGGASSRSAAPRMQEVELVQLATALFARRWFSRIWVLQEFQRRLNQPKHRF